MESEDIVLEISTKQSQLTASGGARLRQAPWRRLRVRAPADGSRQPRGSNRSVVRQTECDPRDRPCSKWSSRSGTYVADRASE